MKTWNIYLTSNWSLVDVVTAHPQHESWDVKTWWLENSMTAQFRGFTEDSVTVSEPDHMS